MSARRPTILLVEDDAYFRRLLSLAFGTAGFETREARDGYEAITLLEWGTPDAVVLDMVMPGLDGRAVHDEILANARTRSIPIIIVTGADTPLGHLKAAAILHKPVAADHVVAVVRRYVPDALEHSE